MSFPFYRGRIAPTPTGYLHVGHARTFWEARCRARANGGEIILRNENLDQARCKPEYTQAMMEDLAWFGIDWDEGPDVGGPYGPYTQSERHHFYEHAWQSLYAQGAIYPSPHSRKDVEEALTAPHYEGQETIFPPELRPETIPYVKEPGNVNWRFRVPDGAQICFEDENYGGVAFVAGKDFGDFLVWRKDGFPSYELAVVVDDYSMQVTEVVRGADLMLSTAKQLLLLEVLGWNVPNYYHCPLVCDAQGNRLAKRAKSLSLRELREQGYTPAQIRENWLGMQVVE
jgi:glutamyl-tRNA synthetase